MLFKRKSHRKAAKRTARRLSVVGLVLVGALVLVPSAFAECGPGFSSKSQLIHYAKKHPSYARGLRKALLKHKVYTGYNADETVLNYLRVSEQVVKAAPAGYKLKTNTWCPSGAGKYQPYHGLLDNMGGKLMLWHCVKGGKCVPLLKGYCMNFVMGPGIGHPHHPKRRKPHKCGCKKNKKPKPKPPVSCEARGLINGPNGSCVTQTVTVNPKQECEANNHSTTGCVQETTTVVVNCGNYSSGNSGTVEQGDNCTQKKEENTCVNNSCNENHEEPCGCQPPEEPEKPEVTPYTEVSCTGFEEITGGASFLVDCEVNTNTGKPISLSAHSNDSNSRVSGINCLTNGGLQTCPPTGGTFEFRVSRINSGSTILSSSITAVASAGGVESKPFTSDPFPVDPEEGGFKN